MTIHVEVRYLIEAPDASLEIYHPPLPHHIEAFASFIAEYTRLRHFLFPTFIHHLDHLSNITIMLFSALLCMLSLMTLAFSAALPKSHDTPTACGNSNVIKANFSFEDLLVNLSNTTLTASTETFQVRFLRLLR